MQLGLSGAAALVTGASTGIGRAIAQQLVESGAHVVVSSRQSPAEPVNGAHAEFLGDFATSSWADELVTRAARSLGRLDIVAHCAGGAVNGSFDTLDAPAWRGGLDLNLLSAVDLVRAATPHLRASRGRVLLLGAVSGSEPRAHHSISNVAKAGVAALGKSLSRDLASDGIIVNVIAPGRIRSAQVDRGYPTEQSRRDFAESQIPLQRFGEAHEVASLAAYLVSPLNTYVTGQVIDVDGGMSLSY